MQQSQIFSLVLFTGLFLLLYFGCDTKSKSHKLEEKSRVGNFELVSIERLMREARPELDASAKAAISELEQQLKRSDSDSAKVKAVKRLSSAWYNSGQPLIAGHYADEVAKLEDSPEAWSMSGTTYALAAKAVTDPIEKQHAVIKSREALEKSLSMAPESMDAKINLALTYVEAPPKDEPMKGVMMLLGLNREAPENISVLMQLARLGMQTGQYDKAVARLEKVIELRPTFGAAYCQLALAYKELQQAEKAQLALEKCDIK